MIKEFVQDFEDGKSTLRSKFAERHPEDYKEIVVAVVSILKEHNHYQPDPERVHEIDDGDWQGTLLYLISDKGYQPSTYWYVFVSYGSCSGCDTLQSIHEYDRETPPNKEQVDQYMTLALHVVQGLKRIEAY